MSADVVYPPLFPALLALMLQLGVPSIASLLVMALLAKIGLVIAVYLTARTLNRIYAAIAATLVATAAAQLEAYAWGGYPQLLGLAFGLLASFLLIRYTDTQETWHLWSGLAFVAATLATHVLIGSLLAVCIGVGILHWLYIVDPRGPVWARGLRVGGSIAGVTAIGALLAFFIWRGLRAELTLNPGGLSRWDSLFYVFRDAPWLWAVVFAAAVVVLFIRYWPAHVAATLALGSAWTVTSASFFLVTGEPRSLLIFQVGLILLATLGFGAALENIMGPKTRHSIDEPRSVRHRLLLVGGAMVFFGVVVAGLGAYANAADWYRVVDRAEVAALGRLSDDAPHAALVVAARGHHGNPVGWWVEGYAELPTWTGIAPEFLAFSDEQAQAEVANRIFGGVASDAEILALLRDIGADYLIVDNRGPDSAWLEGRLARSLPVFDDSSALVILEVPSSG
jgi:hypothetical protein